MSIRVGRWLLLAQSALTLSLAPAGAQDVLTLPEIKVTAPSAIKRRTVQPGPPAQVATPAPSPAPTALQGALPIVTDQFATVTVVPREELQRSPGSTLGDVLFSKPGITGSSFAPGAKLDPVMPGLEKSRSPSVLDGVRRSSSFGTTVTVANWSVTIGSAPMSGASGVTTSSGAVGAAGGAGRGRTIGLGAVTVIAGSTVCAAAGSAEQMTTRAATLLWPSPVISAPIARHDVIT